METVMQIVEKGHAARKGRHSSPYLPYNPGVISPDLQEIIKGELNVKSILTGQFSLILISLPS